MSPFGWFKLVHGVRLFGFDYPSWVKTNGDARKFAEETNLTPELRS